MTIDPDAEPTQPHPYLEAMQRSVLADLPNDPGDGGPSDAGGWDDYAAAFDPHFELERLSQRAAPDRVAGVRDPVPPARPFGHVRARPAPRSGRGGPGGP